MDELFFTPITPLTYIKGSGIVEDAGKVGENNGISSFGNVVRSMINEAAEAERNFDEQKYLLATGQIDNAQSVTIAGAYAQLSIEMLVNLRNSALEAYQELMRISV